MRRRALVLFMAAALATGCGVALDDAPRPLEPVTVPTPPRPTPTVVQRSDDGTVECPTGTPEPAATAVAGATAGVTAGATAGQPTTPASVAPAC